MQKDLTQCLKINDIVPTRNFQFAKILSLNASKGKPIVSIIVDPLTGNGSVIKQHQKDGRCYNGYSQSAYDLMPETIATPLWLALDTQGDVCIYKTEEEALKADHKHTTRIVNTFLFSKQ